MSKSIAILLLASFLAACAPTTREQQHVSASTACSSPEQTVPIVDETLEAGIRRAIRKSSGELSCHDLALLTKLELPRGGVSRLEGLEYAVNLKTLDIPGGQVADLEPLGNLRQLAALELPGHALSDISPLSEIESLAVLDLSDNQVSDLNPLFGLTNLYWLDLDDNLVSDLGPLQGLTRLTNLRASRNRISDASVLAGLGQLRWVELAENDLADMDFVSSLAIRLLDLSGNHVRDISPLARSLRLEDGGTFNLANNCIDLGSGDPFLADLRTRVQLTLEPQRAC